MEIVTRLAPLAPLATGAASGAVVLWSAPPMALSVGVSAVSAVAGFVASATGRSALGSHLKAVSVGVLVGAAIREASSAPLKDGLTWTGQLVNPTRFESPQYSLVYAVTVVY